MLNFRINHCTGISDISSRKSNIGKSSPLCVFLLFVTYSQYYYITRSKQKLCMKVREDTSILGMRKMKFQPRTWDRLHPDRRHSPKTHWLALPPPHLPTPPLPAVRGDEQSHEQDTLGPRGQGEVTRPRGKHWGCKQVQPLWEAAI